MFDRLMPSIQQPPVDFRYIASSMDHDQSLKSCTRALCEAVQLSDPLTDRFLGKTMYAVTSLAKSELGEERAAEFLGNMPSVLVATWSGTRDNPAGVGSLVENVWNAIR
jgi:hypothetical protein